MQMSTPCGSASEVESDLRSINTCESARADDNGDLSATSLHASHLRFQCPFVRLSYSFQFAFDELRHLAIADFSGGVRSADPSNSAAASKKLSLPLAWYGASGGSCLERRR